MQGVVGLRDIAKVPKLIRCIPREREALLAFKEGLAHTNNNLSSWGSEARKQDCCASWEGVYCDKYTGHVVKLDLHGRLSLGGRLSSQVGNLTHLQYLDLSFNEFASVESFNLWLPRLSSLTYLDLSTSNLSDAYDWLEAINKLPKLTNLSLAGCGLPSPLIHSSTLFNINSSKSLAHVDLRFNQLTSSIFVIGWLSNYNASLVHLDLSYNRLIGSIPHVLGNMSSLVHLDLCSNQLVGSIPNVFGNMSSLVNLHLCDNQIKGEIPPSFSRLCNLQELSLSNNNFSGQLSWLDQILMSTCPNQNSFKILDLSSNHLSGSIPNLTNFSLLKALILSENQLSGTIPEIIGQMSELEIILLSMNALEGVVSEGHFSKLSRLTILGLSSNSLALSFNSNWVPPFQLDYISLAFCKMGPHFPKWLQTQKNYYTLDLSSTGISDILPSWFWERLSHDDVIDHISLSNNRIGGIIPNSSFEFPSIYPPRVNLSWNQLEGPIPPFFSKASSLDLSNNMLSGLTSFLCPNNASTVSFLDLSSNNFYEQLPNCWMHFGKLAFLDLSDNALFGKIPTTMGSLVSIQTLKITNNGFVGELPSSLKNCTSLVFFDVGENNLSGMIPEWLGVGLPNLAILILRSNHFYGSIPLQLCNLKDIQILDLSINNISGSIPKCINNFTNLAEMGNSSLTVLHKYAIVNDYSAFYVDEASLIWNGIMSKYESTLGLVKSIHFSSNQLTGAIPNEITDLVGLVSLNLSRNNLTGQITPNIGKLQSLDLLDLSHNEIDGTIPTSLLGISGLGKLDLSNNNLSGKIPMGSRLQTYEPYVFAENPLLCGIPLERICSPEQTTPNEQPAVENQDEDNDGFITPGFYMSLGLGFVVGFWGVCGSLIFNKSWRYTYLKFLNGLNDWLYVRVTLIRRQRMLDE
ncbi:receptor-like protein EIX1 isoform X2 [Pyrus x bretschneideri]|uniref:receptor-like protein EIX1 isoform X2 n=1 Tax=Pyrus x bretschneideri TaxID=225117 RepID=UPI00202DF80E|nr:receptor-like protein EIX1 isoform X2 [Pyrus x bretschneideri]